MHFPKLTPQKEQLLSITDLSPERLTHAVNLSHTAAPHLSPRPRRATLCTPRHLRGICHDPADPTALCILEGDDLCVGSLRHPLPLSEGDKTLLPFGRRILLFPDGLSVDPDSGDFEPLGATAHTGGDTVLSLCRPDGTPYHPLTAAPTPPPSPLNGSFWLDTAAIPRALYVYRAGEEGFLPVPEADICLRLSAPGIGLPFRIGDNVTVSGSAAPALKPLTAPHRLTAAGPDHLVLALPDLSYPTPGRLTAPLCVARPLPEQLLSETLFTCGGRVWAVTQSESETAIVACRRGDPTNWLPLPDEEHPETAAFCRKFADMPRLAAGCDHLGTPHFLGERTLVRVALPAASTPRPSVTPTVGLAHPAAARTLTPIGDRLFYLAPDGLRSLRGTTSTLHRPLRDLCDTAPTAAAAGTDGTCLYLSCTDSQDRPRLVVYDPAHDRLTPEDATRATRFVRLRDRLCFEDRTASPAVRAADEQSADRGAPIGIPEPAVRWQAALPLTDGTATIRATRLILHLSLPHTSTLSLALSCDGRKPRHLANVHPCTATLTLPLITPPSRHLTLHLRGQGPAHVTKVEVVTRDAGETRGDAQGDAFGGHF